MEGSATELEWVDAQKHNLDRRLFPRSAGAEKKENDMPVKQFSGRRSRMCAKIVSLFSAKENPDKALLSANASEKLCIKEKIG